MKTRKKIPQLDFGIIKDATEEKYHAERTKFIAEYEIWQEGAGLFMPGMFKKRPDLGEANWNKSYPEGLKSWRKTWQLDGLEEQKLIDTVNELIDVVNSLF